jgi:hypothetical protein
VGLVGDQDSTGERVTSVPAANTRHYYELWEARKVAVNRQYCSANASR